MAAKQYLVWAFVLVPSTRLRLSAQRDHKTVAVVGDAMDRSQMRSSGMIARFDVVPAHVHLKEVEFGHVLGGLIYGSISSALPRPERARDAARGRPGTGGILLDILALDPVR